MLNQASMSKQKSAPAPVAASKRSLVPDLGGSSDDSDGNDDGEDLLARARGKDTLRVNEKFAKKFNTQSEDTELIRSAYRRLEFNLIMHLRFHSVWESFLCAF